MTDHLSALVLDEVAAGLVPAPEHLASCAECRSRLDALRAQNAAFLALPRAQAQRQSLLTARTTRAPLVAVALALAAAVALFFVVPRTADTRIKGAPEVVLLDAQGQAVSHAMVGATLTLAVGGAGFSQVTVTARGTDGASAVLYEGPLRAGARVPLTTLEVTPGDVEVTAQFTDGARHETATMRLQVP